MQKKHKRFIKDVISAFNDTLFKLYGTHLLHHIIQLCSPILGLMRLNVIFSFWFKM